MQTRDPRRRLALFLVPLVVLLAAAGPASGAVWKKEGKSITKKTEISLVEGQILFDLGVKELYCSVTGTIQTEGGSTGLLTKFVVSPCEGGGKWANCKVTVSDVELPWLMKVRIAPVDLFLEETRFKFAVSGPCGLEETLERKAFSVWTPDNASAIGVFGIEGWGELEYVGGFNVSPSGVYGLG